MNKRTLKIFFIISVIFLFLFFLSTKIYAIGEVISSAQSFVNGSNGTSTINPTMIQDMSDILYNTLLTVGVIIAVVVGMILGIKFMTAGIGEKAKVKEMILPYVAGCIVIFGAFTIWKIVLIILRNVS